MNRRRMVFFLVLNVLISALVTISIILIDDHFNAKPDCGTIENSNTAATGGVKVDIISISSPGVLEKEVVFIQNNGTTASTLTGWVLKDNQEDAFTFPQVTLYPGGSILVHTGPGQDTASDLYWDLPEAVWKSGDLAALFDTQNIVRAFYRIP
jgi:hypothetical protein